MEIPSHLKRQTSGHGYDYGCDCDLYDGGDPYCTCDLPYEIEKEYIQRLIQKIIELEKLITS